MLNILILCPSARLAHSIKNDIAAQHINAGQTQWQSANVMTLSQWLDSIIEQKLLCGEIVSPQTLLSPLNEQILWQQVIQQSLIANSFSDLFDVAGLATAAMEANKYLVAWRLHVPRDQQSEEAQQFVQWQRAFVQRCKQLNVLESVRYLDWQLDTLNTDIKEHALGASIHAALSPVKISRVEFAGFDQTAPQEQRLRDILLKQGFEVAEYASKNTQPALTQHIALENQEAECRAAVAWAKQQLAENPHAKLAIVSPKLSEIRNQLADLLDDVFYPESVNPSQFDAPRNYNFSLGTPLSQQPMIQSALNLLRLFSSYNLQQTDVSAILLSPFWSNNSQEADARAQLDAKIREYLPMQFTLAQLLEFAQFQQAKGLNISALLAHIKAAQVNFSNKKLAASAWSQTLAEILSALHWPGERVLSSIEYQANMAWQKALKQLQQLDVLGNGLYQAEAVQILQKICTDLVFQAETENASSIQILGVMEALSAPVDGMWVLHMNDHIWPPPARPNPLLPAFIQRAAKLPNADNSVQTEFANKVQQRLLHSANNIVFSSSKTEGNSQLRASPLMKDILTLETAKLAETLAETLSQLGNKNLELMDDHVAPAVQAGEHVGGGTGLFRAQAICPAWAFYQFRLGAKSLKTPSNGLDSMTRGILVHGVLAEFYENNNFADLRTMSDENLEQAINTAIKIALAEVAKQQKTLSENLLALEHERLFKLVGDWLAYEKQRAIPFEIIACEADKKVMIGGIEVTLKIDRIHQLENGGIEFVDYKTGQKPNMNSWGEPRMIEPQLPIYALYYDENLQVAGVQFGMVKTAEHAFSGVSEVNFDAETDKRKPKMIQQFASWQGLLKHWQASIEAIAHEIKTGEAAVKFDDESDLAYCEVTPLLRLPERQLQFERFKESAK
jgi:probable DNA repair protein